MGWCTGGEVYDPVALMLKEEFGDKKLKKQERILSVLISALEDRDWDTAGESGGLSIASDNALREAGYHIWEEGTCEWLDDYWDACRCGYDAR